MKLSSRSVMTLLLTIGLCACDKQSPPAPQGNDAKSPAISGEATSQPQSKDGAFSYVIDRSKAGTPAPNLSFHTSDGQDATLQDFAGQPMLVNLWATWCAPCIAEMPELNRVAAELGPKGLTVLTISQDMQEEVAAPFFKKNNLPHLKSWTDPENKLGFHYATGQLPTTILYNADGKETARIIGALDWSGKEGRQLINEAMTK